MKKRFWIGILILAQFFSLFACTKAPKGKEKTIIGEYEGIKYYYEIVTEENNYGKFIYPVISGGENEVMASLNQKIKDAAYAGTHFLQFDSNTAYNNESIIKGFDHGILTVEHNANYIDKSVDFNEPFLVYDNYDILTGEIVNPKDLVDIEKISNAFINKTVGLYGETDKNKIEKLCEYVVYAYGKNCGERLTYDVYRKEDGVRLLTYYSLMFNGEDNLIVVYDVDQSLGTIAKFEFDRATYAKIK